MINGKRQSGITHIKHSKKYNDEVEENNSL